MSENFIRHLIAIFGTLTAVVIYWAGYSAGKNGWFWTIGGMVVVYIVIYKLVDT